MSGRAKTTKAERAERQRIQAQSIEALPIDKEKAREFLIDWIARRVVENLRAKQKSRPPGQL